MTIALDIITDAMIRGGLSGIGETIDNSTANYALTVLNTMWDMWGAEITPLYNIVDSQSAPTPTPGFTLVPGTAAYTVGPANFLGLRPPAFAEVYLLDGNNVSYYLDIIQADAYSRLIYKVAPGRPDRVYINYGDTTLTMTFYPTPAYTDAVHALYYQPLPGGATIATVNTSVVMPPGYLEAYVTNLAVRLCEAFGKQVSPTLAARADWTKRAITTANENVYLLQNTLPTQKRRFFNILTGGTAGNQ